MFWKDKGEKCFNCHKYISDGKAQILYSLVVSTSEKVHFLPLLALMEDLANHLMKQYIHLSASQVILLRPDILEGYLVMKFDPEKPIIWFLCEHLTCAKCYTVYVNYVPTR